MSGIHKLPKRGRQSNPNTETQIVGGTKISSKDGEPKILDHRTQQKGTTISNSKGEEVVVKEHTRSRPKGK